MSTKLHASNAGLTLLELTFSLAILTIVMGVLFTMSQGIGDTAKIQDVKVITNDEARRAMLGVAPRLRQAVRSSVNFSAMPTDILVFRMPRDADGNGLAVDKFNVIELGPEVTIRRDQYDQNKDGLTFTQLIMISGESIRVLANNLSPDVAPLPPENGKPTAPNQAGFWVENVDGSVLITIRTQGESRRGNVLRQELAQLVNPRN